MKGFWCSCSDHGCLKATVQKQLNKSESSQKKHHSGPTLLPTDRSAEIHRSHTLLSLGLCAILKITKPSLQIRISPRNQTSQKRRMCNSHFHLPFSAPVAAIFLRGRQVSQPPDRWHSASDRLSNFFQNPGTKYWPQSLNFEITVLRAQERY